MRASNMLITTLKETPTEAQISSHILLLRSGMIRKLVSGVYTYMPLGLRTINKIESIVRDELEKAGCVELLCSAIQPKELWEESGRWAKYGAEMMRFKDRNDREFCLGPTHEEVFTDIVRNTIKSSKNLPINLFQIQTKYRDEQRPRFGLIRGREFIMKDGYSFDKDEEGLNKSYKLMSDTYKKIFDRLGIKYKIVLADTGAIGGSDSHQFMALSEIGESEIIYCDKCGYAADVEKAVAIPNVIEKLEKPVEKVYTPKAHSIEEVSAFLKEDPSSFAKTILYKNTENNEVVAVMVRGDREVNEVKLVNALNTSEAFLTFASDEDIKNLNTVFGFVGPIGLKCRILVDKEVALSNNLIVGSNELDYHLLNVCPKRDFEFETYDLRNAVLGDRCPVCGKPLESERGIEVGQIFKLQTKYSKAMDCSYIDENGKSVPMLMGCYGIGISRTLSSIVEQYHDDFGIKFPLNVAPYHAVVIPINYKDEEMSKLADVIYDKLKEANIEVILDDRDQKPGFKFKDWDLMGIPLQIIVGRDAVNSLVEFKMRSDNSKELLPATDAIEKIVELVNKSR